MKSPQDTALQRAQDFARDRGWRQEPLTWEEVEALVGLTFGPDQEDWDAGYAEGYQAGRAEAEPVTRDDVLDWCADHGYLLAEKAAAS